MSYLSTLKDFLYILAIAGPALWGAWSYLKSLRGDVSWRMLEKAVGKLHMKMEDEKYKPDYIVCIGRAGGVGGAMLSHRFRTSVIPIIVLTYSYDLLEHGKAHERIEKLRECCSVKEGLQKVLLFGLDIMSGNTMLAAAKELEKRNIREYKTACLYWNPVAKLKPDLFAETRAKRPQYPWMLNPFSLIHESSRVLPNESPKELQG